MFCPRGCKVTTGLAERVRAAGKIRRFDFFLASWMDDSRGAPVLRWLRSEKILPVEIFVFAGISRFSGDLKIV